MKIGTPSQNVPSNTLVRNRVRRGRVQTESREPQSLPVEAQFAVDRHRSTDSRTFLNPIPRGE